LGTPRHDEQVPLAASEWGGLGGTLGLVSSCKAGPVEAQREPVESISAVTLLTVNMVEAVAFYQALGFHLLYGGEKESFTSFRVGAGYLNLQLGTVGCPRTAVWGRVVFWVDDVDAMHRRALAAGFDPETSPADAPWGERYFHIHDADGHELSFARPLGPR
jgi:catechol 2,3-dioxygenase-like lactoylglutathione lyase family enzyme